MSDDHDEATQDEAISATSPTTILPMLRTIAMRPDTATTALVDDVATLSKKLSHAKQNLEAMRFPSSRRPAP